MNVITQQPSAQETMNPRPNLAVEETPPTVRTSDTSSTDSQVGIRGGYYGDISVDDDEDCCCFIGCE